MSFQVALSYKLRLRSDSTGRIFDHLKNLTGHFVHTDPFNIFALFTRDCRTVIFPSKASRVKTRLVNPCSSRSQYLFAMFLSFSSCVTTHPCSHAFAVQKNWPVTTVFTPCPVQIFDQPRSLPPLPVYPSLRSERQPGNKVDFRPYRSKI